MGRLILGFGFKVVLLTMVFLGRPSFMFAISEDAAFRFNQTNYLYFPVSLSLPNNFFSSNQWTIEMRLKPAKTSGGQELFMGLWHKPRLVSYGTKLVLAGFVNSVYTPFVEVPNAIIPEEWNHLVCIANGANYKIFVNGTEKGSCTYKQIDTGIIKFLLGSDGESVAYNLTGLMDDVRIYNRALSANEISNNYTNKDAPATNGLVSWWKLDGNTDDVMKKNNALVMGSSIWADLSEPAVLPPPKEGDAISVGEFVIDPPTIHSLSFRWFVTGDDNGNATTTVSFRKKKEMDWRPALPMLRVNREIVNRNYHPFVCGNLFAGSLLNLEENTEYEVRIQLNDPDGGEAERIATATTRATPKWFNGERVIHLYPQDFTGEKLKPNFTTLNEAAEKAEPGDLVLIHKGTYSGPILFGISGTSDKPIVFRKAGDGEVIIDGQNTDGSVIDAQNGKNYLSFEGLTIRNGRYGINASASNGLIVRHCKIYDVNFGIITFSLDTANWYIADNILIGRYPSWYPRNPINYNDEGINVVGTGHIVCYNKISKFGDGIATSDWSQITPPEWATMTHPPQIAMDIYNNDIFECMDDGIEVDYTLHNIRVWNNRIMNTYSGLSAQPVLGGPAYWWRNLIYNATYSPLKLHNSPSGLFILNNTCIASRKGFDSEETWMNVILRNNLFLGVKCYGATSWYTLETGSAHPLTSLDYNGYRKTDFPYGIIRWSPDEGKTWGRYKSIEEFYQQTGYEQHGLEIAFSDFVNAPLPEEGTTYSALDIDLRLKEGVKEVDAGVVLPQVTDDFLGKAPDVGALEFGRPSPIYGPRERSYITLKKTCDKKYATKKETLTYTITYANEGQETATDVNIIEVLPENCKLQNAKCEMQNAEIRYWYDNKWQETFSESAGKIKWIIPEVTPSSSGTVSFSVRVE